MDKSKQIENVQMNVGIDPIRTPVLYADAIMITFNGNGVVLDLQKLVI
jgi:hypothetical protein